jgi:hypothetical protein
LQLIGRSTGLSRQPICRTLRDLDDQRFGRDDADIQQVEGAIAVDSVRSEPAKKQKWVKGQLSALQA